MVEVILMNNNKNNNNPKKSKLRLVLMNSAQHLRAPPYLPSCLRGRFGSEGRGKPGAALAVLGGSWREAGLLCSITAALGTNRQQSSSPAADPQQHGLRSSVPCLQAFFRAPTCAAFPSVSPKSQPAES